MPKIILETYIDSSLEICFDLSRSIDLHQISTVKTNERAVGGVIEGLIEMNETVTWEAVHFGIKQNLTSKITAFERPYRFVDEQIKGAFKSIYHEHTFEMKDGIVLMKDVFQFESPYGFLGTLFNKLVLTNYLKSFLMKRNAVIKEYAESEKWKLVKGLIQN